MRDGIIRFRSGALVSVGIHSIANQDHKQQDTPSQRSGDTLQMGGYDIVMRSVTQRLFNGELHDIYISERTFGIYFFPVLWLL